MQSSFPAAVIKDVLERLDALDVIELVDWHPESIQKIGETIRCCCPVHKEPKERTLVVDLARRVVRCSEATCPAHTEVSLIEMYALAKPVSFDEAMHQLADEFGFVLMAGSSKEDLDRASSEAQQYLERAKTEQIHRVAHTREAEKRFRSVLSANPDDMDAALGLFRIMREQGNLLDLAQFATQVASRAETGGGSTETAVTLLKEYLEVNNEDLAMRLRLADLLAKQQNTDDAVAELMDLADTAEQSQQYDLALSAYRRISALGSDTMDVHPMMQHLLVTMGRDLEAVELLRERAGWLVERGRYGEASQALLEILELNPNDPTAQAEAAEALLEGPVDGEDRGKVLELIGIIRKARGDQSVLPLARMLAVKRPDDLEVLSMLSELLRSTGHGTEAHQQDRRLAEALGSAGETARALEVLERLLSEAPEDHTLLLQLAELHIASGNLELGMGVMDAALEMAAGAEDSKAALSIAQRLADLAPREMQRQRRLLNLLAQFGREGEARGLCGSLVATAEKNADDQLLVELLRLAQELEPNEPKHLLSLADSLERLGKSEEAAFHRREAARAMHRIGRPEHAEGELRLLIEDNPQDFDSMTLLMEVLRSQKKTTEAQSYGIRLVDQRMERGEFGEARAMLDLLLADAPNDADLLSRLSTLCTELGDSTGLVKVGAHLIELYRANRQYDEAIEQAEEILQLNPTHLVALTHLAELMEMKGDRTRAAALHFQRAAVLREQGDNAGEQRALEEVLSRDSRNADALERVILLAYANDDRTEGAAHLEEFAAASTPTKVATLLRELLLHHPDDLGLHMRQVAVLRKADDPEALLAAMQSLILLHERADRWRDAIALYREALVLEPDSVFLRMSHVEALKRVGDRAAALREMHAVAKLHLEQGSLEDALAVFEQMQRLDPADERGYSGQAEIYRRRDRSDLAADRMRQYADTLRSNGDLKEAAKVLKAAMEFDPKNMDLRRQLVAILAESGKPEDAVKELVRLGEQLEAEGDPEGAISTLREAVTLKPMDVKLRRRLIKSLEDSDRRQDATQESVGLAEALSEGGNPTAALEILEETLQRYPSNMKARRLRAEIFLATGDDKRAIEEFRQMAPFLDRVESGGGGALLAPEATELKILPEYDFDSFVVGSRNNFAYATAKAVGKSPGTAYNPLFLYSDVGLGKTHLLHAIANYMLENMPNIKITYTNVEDFTAELIEAIETNSVTQFRNRHKSADILLIDDVQFLAGKERSQEELFHIFNTLFQAKKQIVVTSDRPPKDIAHLEKRLKSRFGAGVVVDIQPPDVETRIAIMKREMSEKHTAITMPDEIMKMIAERMDSNVRELKGALNQVILSHELGGEALTAENVRTILDRLAGAGA